MFRSSLFVLSIGLIPLCYVLMIRTDAFADAVVEGQINLLPQSPLQPGDPNPHDSGGSERTITEVDHIRFSVNSFSEVVIDVLAAEWDPINEVPVDLNGDGEFATMDSYIYLFRDDGDLRIVAGNDDWEGADTNGSLWELDSYMTLPLEPGEYVLAIGVFDLNPRDAIAGINDNGYGPFDSLDGFVIASHGDYRVDFLGDVTIIPEPSALLLVVFAGVMFASRRNRM